MITSHHFLLCGWCYLDREKAHWMYYTHIVNIHTGYALFSAPLMDGLNLPLVMLQWFDTNFVLSYT